MTNMHTFARLHRSLTLLFSLMLGIGAAHAAETVTYYHTDALGTPVMESNAAGAVTYAREYKPYGEQALGAVKNGPGFTGHIADADTGLIYMQARFYDPAATKFLSRDPVMTGFDSGANFNRYWYGNSSPLRFTDPDGMQACSNECMRMRETSDRVGGGIRGFTDAQVKRFVEVLNSISASIRHYSEKAAVNFFTINAIALQKKVGREIGANLEERSASDYRVLDFHYDNGARAKNEVTTWVYEGGFTWKGILHTHPDVSGFSGLGVYGQGGKYYGLYTSSDAQQAFFHQTNVYVARPDMSVMKLNHRNWSKAVNSDTSGRKIYADEFDENF